ncbi:hypothetical protein A2V56_01980 [Candidatus Woesebacteria bacterium RBG_19FT_COMBO_42_9]|uniref:Membrane protein 6-pyruvoyl-tetrahydropterin synthase-related domain-containing protein n=1 Tax=Candidatus Woesebacteria bacterium RBG_16_42_24 TaxID=1802485 RepID=A0A1F7XKV4_9BACT|nr:MAG: hypothetical protein A2V97_02575 [Candidatus Woesebacteria bacterium RBG_16_42_24]OGM17081.1 MAG: hypothetical protein A2V56_01980 [Candidatus Woesebacteria bacterium RBG_19FT_COMBO_42_9]OGM67889.1 MAG: hypothetical protein A2985_02240 [Candidatus Woesebacteria bacterium RIFCSPLOWO2_01_FULL_43_11]
MFPSQTSLIPVAVAVSRYLEKLVESNGWLAIRSFNEGWYPYWYLGLPAKYLLGPVVPMLLVLLHKLFPQVSLFSLSFILITFSFIVGAIGWGELAGKISGNRIIGVFVSIAALILPWRYLSSLALEETTFIVARNLLPWVLFMIYVYLTESTRRKLIVVLLALSLLFLVNTSILPILIVGAGSVILAASYSAGQEGKSGKLKGIWGYSKKFLKALILSLVVVTLWYTPGYWSTVLFNPSIGGASAGKVILRIFEILRNGLPFLLAIVSVFFSGKLKSRITVFTLTWLLTFLFLSVFRLLGDPDFWQDWSSWFYELEIGIGFLMAQVAYSLIRKNEHRYSVKIYIVILILFLSPYWLSFRIYNTLGKPALISQSIPQGVYALTKLSEIAGEKRVFLSGSTVFWANALYDLNQVRGGQDKVAINPYWDHAAYQIREGESGELASVWLQSLGITYALVHTPKSYEYYHDFVNLSKWKDVGKVIWQDKGDIILEMPKNSLARSIDLEKEYHTVKPKDGKDLSALKAYLLPEKLPLKVSGFTNGYWISQDSPADAVRVAVTFDSNWKAYAGDGRKLKVEKDILGYVLIYTEGQREIRLAY